MTKKKDEPLFIRRHISTNGTTVRKYSYDDRLAIYNEYCALSCLSEVPDLTYKVPYPIRYSQKQACEILDMSFVPGSTLMDVWYTMNQGEWDQIVNGVLYFCENEAGSQTHTRVSRCDRSSGPRMWRFVWGDALRVKECISDFITKYMPHPAIGSILQAWISIHLEQIDCSTTCLTHLDLNPSNIMVDADTKRLIGVIDWERSGFYPAWWFTTDLLCYAISPFQTMLKDRLIADESWTEVHNEVARMICALKRFTELYSLPDKRAQSRKKGWEMLVDLVGDELTEFTEPNFDYRSLIPGRSMRTVGDWWWREDGESLDYD